MKKKVLTKQITSSIMKLRGGDDVSKKLAAIRRFYNVSQKEMAAELGISERSYSDKETGKYQFKANEMYAISKKFNMTIEDIFFSKNFENHEVLSNLEKGVV